MNELCSFFNELETLQLQLLNKLAYDTVVSRVQTRCKDASQRYNYLLHPFGKWAILEYDSHTNTLATVLSDSFDNDSAFKDFVRDG